MNKNGKEVIAILTDKSFPLNNMQIPINHIIDIVKNNHRTAVFLYGMCNRIDDVVERYCATYRVSKTDMIKFEYDATKTLHIPKAFAELLLWYSLDKVYIFRDNLRSSDTNILVNLCNLRGIPVTNINSNGETCVIEEGNPNDGKKYFKMAGGK